MKTADRAHRRTFGQFFTPPTICAVACAAAFGPDAKRVIDPTCGTGDMLIAAASRAKHLGLEGLEVTGVEVDPALAVKVGDGVSNDVIRADLFAVLAQLNGSGAVNHRFDAVVGNPPYVRFESLGSLYRNTNPHLLGLTATRFPGRADGELAALGIKSMLLMSCFPSDWSTARRLEAAHAGLVSRENMGSLNEHERLWADAVIDYPIRADLSIPVWLAAWRLVRPGGRIAFVTTDSWESRTYGHSLRKFIGVALQPVLIVRQQGSWFNNAQVRASLVVLEARPHDPNELCLTVEAPQDANLAAPETLVQIARSNGLGIGPDTFASAAPSLLRLMQSSDGIPGWRILRPAAAEALRQVRSVSSGPNPQPFLSEGLRAMVPRSFVEMLEPLRELGVTVQQGLRTGCNPFFYATRVSEADDEVTIRTDIELGGREIAVDRRYLLPVLRYQREIDGYATSSESLPSRAIVVGTALTSLDYMRMSELYPDAWQAQWTTTAGVHALAGTLDDHIQRSATQTLMRGGRERRIPQLSAVQPNERWPSSGSNAIPAPPRGWYSLPISPRHVPDILVARVVDRLPRFILNDAAVLVDANFSSLTICGPLPKLYYLAVLNSSWVRAWMESACTPMGGGALKVEAEQLAKMPIPRLEGASVEILSRLGFELSMAGHVSAEWLQMVDKLVIGDDAHPEGLRREGGALAMRRSPKNGQFAQLSSS